MSVFLYAGVDRTGRSVQGSLEAGSERVAYEQLQTQGIIPTKLKAAEGDEAAASGRRGGALSFGGVPFSRRVSFVRELGTFVQADVPLLDALGVIRKQEAHPIFREVLDDLHRRVQGGESFSKALGCHPRVFSPLLVSMVRVGETGGMMGPVLDQMAKWMEGEEEIRGEIVGAMAYPGMIFTLGIATVGILMTFVLPRITAIFAGMEGKLPTPTKILLASSGFLRAYWWAIPIVVGVAAFAIHRALRTPGGRRAWDVFSLRVPIFGRLTLEASIARFARATAAMLTAGVPLLEALRVVRGLLGNSVLMAMIDRVIEGVTKGQALATMLEQNANFPPTAIHLLRVGERTGRLPDMFARVAEVYEKRMRNQIKILMNLLSPLMIVALAVLVAFIAISILLPIFQMNKMMR